MTSRPHGSSIIASLLCLAMLAASAPAESPWVLWEQTMDPWGALAVLRLGTWPSREACEQERARKERALPELRTSYACLPGTVDPREAKQE